MKDHIRQSNLIEGIDDPKEDAQSLIAWKWLSKQKNLTHDVICKVQKIITLHQPLSPDQRGYYRNCNVRVGGYHAPDYSHVHSLMNFWIFIHEMLSPINAHICFETIHPFVDGNGRTGRMLLWWHEKELGQKPTLFRADERAEYYKLFRVCLNNQ